MEEKDSNDKKLYENNLSNEPKNEENVEETSNTHSITLIQLIIILIVIALVISVIYIYTNDDRNYVLDKVGIPSNSGAITEVNETKVKHLGGTGVGAGTLFNICKRMLNIDSFDKIESLAKIGNVEKSLL